MDEFSQYKRVTPGQDEDEFAQYKRAGAPSTEAPGWFQPGSKSEAMLRGFSQGATLGFGDELQAGLRAAPSLFDPKAKFSDEYAKLRNEERAGNTASATENPWSYIAGNLVGAAPQAANVAGVMRNAPAIAGSVRAGQAARGLGAGGTYGAVRGAGQAETVADIPAEAGKQALIEGGVAAAIPGMGAVTNKVMGGDNIVSRFAQNYKDLAPEITAGAGPIVVGGTGGAIFGASPLAPQVKSMIGDPAYTRQETWSSDPGSKMMDTAFWGLAGATGGKVAKTLSRTGGAVQKTMRGEGGQNIPGPTGGGAAGGSRTPPPNMPPQGGTPPPQPKGPTAPQGVAPEVARQDAMNKVSNSDTGEKAGQQAFGKIREQLDDWQNLGRTPPIPQRPSQAMGDLVQDIDGSMVPRGTERIPGNSVVPAGPLKDLSQDALAEAIKKMPPSTANLPRPPNADNNPWEQIVKTLNRD